MKGNRPVLCWGQEPWTGASGCRFQKSTDTTTLKHHIFMNTTIHNKRKIRPNGSIRVLYESLSIVNVGYDLVKLYVLEWHYRIFELEGEVLP